MARALRSVLNPDLLTIVVNVGDNTERYGVHIAADPDTMLYTLSDTVGPNGWGRENDTFAVMDELTKLGVDTSMALGDKDMALCALRASRLAAGEPLSSITGYLSSCFGLGDLTLLPATDDPLETFVRTDKGEWLDFQTYFVDRHHSDGVSAVAYHGSPEANPAPGVIEAIKHADVLVIAPSNPPLSIWPILAIDEIDAEVKAHPTVVGVSPLFGGKPLKGPADAVMKGVGLPGGTAGVLDAYANRLRTLFIDEGDEQDVALGSSHDVQIIAADTRLDGTNGPVFAARLLAEMSR